MIYLVTSDNTRDITLRCRYCPWRPADDVTVGVVSAHFETEPDHGDGAVAFELVVICRCGAEMACEREIRSGRMQYACPAPCYRTRIVTQHE